MTIKERHRREQLEQALKSKDTYANLLEKAYIIMPQVIDPKKWTDQGRVNTQEMMKLFGIGANMAYRLRKDVLKKWHEKDAERRAQYKST